MSLKGVSVIICCYNSRLLIERTLQHIAVQNLKENLNCEVILVDNASADNTSEKAQSVWNNSGNNKIAFKMVNETQPGLTYARQKGINEARYEYLVFCDDDNWLDGNYINNVFELFNQYPRVAVLGGTGVAEFEDEDLKPEWFEIFYQGYATGSQGNGEHFVNAVYGAGMAVRKSVLKQVMEMAPMFLHGRRQNQLTSGEDSEICMRVRLAGHQVLFSQRLTFKHFLTTKRLTWDYLKRLHTGLAKTYPVLDLYEKALTRQSRFLPFFYWLKKAVYYWGIYLKYWPKHYSAYRKDEGTIEEIHHITWKNIALSYFEYNFKTLSIYRRIVALKVANTK